MLWPAFIFLLVLWFSAVVASYTLGGFIHLLLALAVMVLLAQVITRKGKTRGTPGEIPLPPIESEGEQRRDGAA